MPSSDDNFLRREALLFLPGAAFPSFASLKSVYEPAICTVLSALSSSVRGTTRSAILDIAVAVSDLPAPDPQLRIRSFDSLQRLLANTYRLVGVSSVKQSIDLDSPGGIDARVFFVKHHEKPIELQRLESPQIGPVVSLASLAASGFSWECVYSIDSPQGDALLLAFKEAREQISPLGKRISFQKLPATLDIEPLDLSIETGTKHFTPHYSVAVGGTFDHLHTGHKLLLTATVLALDPYVGQSPQKRRIVTIGITGDEMLVNKKYSEFLESWEERWRGVWAFLQSIVTFSSDCAQIKFERLSNPGPNGKRVIVSIGANLEFRIVQISDPFGPTITDEDITALVVSKETRSGGKSVNDEREKNGWAKLEVFEVDVLDMSEEAEGAKGDASAETFESKISSTEIRRHRMKLAKSSHSL
ncbi:phosphopantetheine adenylyltransferase [Emydomyces testavorans]|uniref:Phosphopantetheine adenylyltransferase n=1 Tax=Emydomyces testavorans TaxID=2070801 RepID=A0AAF0DLZ6_9EURO|nr:phosphopantetheine adenylyltransferase [Emydomyces testavorans]